VPPRATLPSVRAPIQEPSRLHLLPVFAHDVQPHFCPLSPPPRVLEQSRERFLSRQLQLAKPVSASITLVTRPQPGARRIWANPCAQLDYVRDMRLLLKICNTSRHIPRVSHIPLHLALHPATSGSCRIRPGTSRESGASDATSGASRRATGVSAGVKSSVPPPAPPWSQRSCVCLHKDRSELRAPSTLFL